MIRLIALAFVVVVGFTGPVWLFLVGAAAYGFWFSGYELVILGMLVDAFFGDPENILPLYTGLAVLWLILVELVKPQLLLYNQEH